ncbi:MAG: AAA family ATPase, partial [Paracoccaceae bacterium]
MAANFRDAQITVRMLGGLEIRKNGAPVALPTRHSALLFAALALEPGAPISRARLASLFWGGRGEPQARGSLRQTIYRLRRVFEDVTPEPLIATSMAISVSPALVWSDAAEILSGGHGAQSLVNGELLAGWDGGSAELDDWIAGQRETIRQASGRVLRDAAEAAERSGDFAALADSAERLSRLDPFDEAALRLRMSALARMGRIAAAEELHHEFVFRLAHDLSARPSEETTRLAAEISERSGAFAPVAPPFAQNLQSPVGAAATPAPEDLAERRQITVVAIALSPDRAENDADPEAIAERLHRLGALVGDLASKFGGTCDRAASLAYVCVFGWPRAMEDAAERAARVAAAIVDIARGEEIAIGLGVATSEVIAEPGAGRFIGRAPDEALRLAAGARAGEILVSGRARALLEPAFGFEESPAPSTAGARALTGERIAESRFAARHSGQIGRMVGRERELDLLLGLWRLADRGEGQVAVIRGEPGIGKSRLVEAMARELDAEAPQRTLLQCSRFAADTAFGPIAEHIRLAGGLAAVTGARTREERLTGYLRSLDLHGDPAAADIGVLAGVTRSTAPPSAERRGALLASLVRLLTGGSDDRATLLVLEDAHWADPSTLDVLLRLAVESPERRIMIVVTSRPEFDHGALPDANLTALSLRALSRSQVEDLARDIAGGR